MTRARITYRYDKDGKANETNTYWTDNRRNEANTEANTYWMNNNKRSEANNKENTYWMDNKRSEANNKANTYWMDNMHNEMQEDYDRSNSSSREETSGNVIPLYPEDSLWANRNEEIRDEELDWTSSVDQETLQLEKIIREAGRREPSLHEPATADMRMESDQQPSYDSNGYVDPYPFYESSKRYFERPSRSFRQIPWFQVVASVTSAVLTGLLLGYLVLSFFEDSIQETNNGQALTQGTIPGTLDGTGNESLGEGQSIDSGGGDSLDIPSTGNADISGQEIIVPGDRAEEEQNLMNGVTVNVPKQSFYMLQFGVFSSFDGARDALSQLIGRNLAGSYLESEQKHYVFAAAATEKQVADTLLKQFQERELPLYTKTYELPDISKIAWDGEAKDMEQYLQTNRKLANMVTAVSSLRLQDEFPDALDRTTIDALKSEYEPWSQLSKKMADEAKGDQKEAILNANKYLDTAVASLLEYENNISRAKLWQAQTGAMAYLVTEHKLTSAG